MPRQSSLTARALDVHGFVIRSQGGGMTCAAGCLAPGFEVRVWDGSQGADYCYHPTHLNRPVFVQVVDLEVEEREGADFKAAQAERRYPTLRAFLDTLGGA